MQPEELGKSAFIDANEESGCDKKDEKVIEDVKVAKNFTLKEFSEVFHNVKGARNKMS